MTPRTHPSSPTATPLLRVHALCAAYGESAVLHGVDLTVDRHQIVALVGANGAGKSTMLAAICGLLRRCSGQVELAGVRVDGWAPERISRAGLALTPEGRRVFANLTVAENLRLGGVAHAVRPGSERELELLELFPILRSRYRQKAGSLSGGEQQLLAIARSLMSRPKLLLLDEPSLGLAPQMIDKVFELIDELRRRGLSILLVEQNVALALQLADAATVLANGRVALAGPARELAANDRVRQAYLGAGAGA